MHCSIGVSEYPRDAQEPIALLGAALAAADRAQVMGGGRYCVASESADVHEGIVAAPALAAASSSDSPRDLAGERAEIASRINR